jgi:hypothetical protein
MAHHVGCCFCVCCVLCFVLPPKNPVFLNVTILSYILKNENYELCFLVGFFVDQITTGKNYDRKKRYSRLAAGWNKSQITIFCLKRQTPTITGKNYNWKKRYSRLAVGWNTCQNMNTNYDRKNYDRKKGTVLLLTPFATHVTFYFYYVCAWNSMV